MANRNIRKRRSLDKKDAQEEDEVEILDQEGLLEFHRLIGLGARGLALEREKVTAELAAKQILLNPNVETMLAGDGAPAPAPAPNSTPPAAPVVTAPDSSATDSAPDTTSFPIAPETAAAAPDAVVTPASATEEARIASTNETLAKDLEDLTIKDLQIRALESLFMGGTLNPAPIRGRFASFSSERRLYKCKKCNFHFDFVVYISKTSDYSILSAGMSFKQGDKQVEIVAFSHDRDIRLLTASGDVLGPIIPLRSVLEEFEEAKQVDYSQYLIRQMHLLMQYEDGVTESERQEHLKTVEDELRVLKPELKSAKSELVLLRGREKSLKDDLQEAEKELSKEKAKNKKLAKEVKDLADSSKLLNENAQTQSALRKENESLRTEVDLKRREVESLSTELERANKRQRTSEKGDYQPVTSAPQNHGEYQARAVSTPFDVTHFEQMRVKSISFNATY